VTHCDPAWPRSGERTQKAGGRGSAANALRRPWADRADLLRPWGCQRRLV